VGDACQVRSGPTRHIHFATADDEIHIFFPTVGATHA
jgi:hypothetical protein